MPTATLPTCHPDRKHRAKGLCGSCYVMSRPEYGLRRIPRAVVARLLERQGGRCIYCGRAISLADATAEHIIARSQGGSDDEANLAAACGPCNSRKWADEPPAGVVGALGPAPRPRDERGAAGDITLAEAGELLDRSPATLRNQVKNGRLQARLIGKTWITTRAEVERYRRESLGQVGRPAKGD